MARARLISLTDKTSIELDVVLDENVKMTASVTDYPLESGISIADFMEVQPIKMTMSGVVAGKDTTDKLRILTSWWEGRHRLQYIGRSSLNGYVMTNFDVQYDVVIGDGFSFKMSLQEIRVVSPLMFEDVDSDPAQDITPEEVQTQVDKVEDVGQVTLTALNPPVRLAVTYTIPYQKHEFDGTRRIVDGKFQAQYYISVPLHRIPFRLSTKIKGETFILEFAYNGAGKYYTASLIKGDVTLSSGSKLMYGEPLFMPYTSTEFPRVIIVPNDPKKMKYKIESGPEILLHLLDVEENSNV